MVCVFQVFSQDLKSNTCTCMKVLDLGFRKGYEKFSKALIFEFFITFSSCTSDKESFSGL